MLLALGFLLLPIAVYVHTIDSVFDQYTILKWFLVYALGALSALSFLTGQVALRVPAFGRMGFSILGLSACFLLSAATNLPGNYGALFLEWMAFCSLFFIAFSTAEESENAKKTDILLQANQIATWVVVSYGMLQWFGFQPISNLAHNAFPASLFGFQNMTGEFICVSILLQEILLLRKRKNENRYPVLSLGLLALSFIYLLLLSSRSTYVGLLVAHLALLFTLNKDEGTQQRMKRFTLIGTAAMAIFLASYALLSHTSFIQFDLQSKTPQLVDKSDNVRIRKIRWKNTLKMIEAHPFGVGPGNFVFSYPEFNHAAERDYESKENILIESPHNAYLGLAAENGILALVFLLILLFFLLPKMKGPWLAPFVFVLVDGVFAFPLATPYLFFVTAVFLGLGLRASTPYREISPKKSKLAALFAGLFLLTFSGLYGYVHWVEAEYPDDVEKNTLACNLLPSEWKTCIQEIALAQAYGLEDRVEITSKKLLEKNPGNFLAMRFLSLSLIRQHRAMEACPYLEKYNGYFAYPNSLHQTFVDTCTSSKK